MCELKNNLIESGRIRQSMPRRIVPDNAGLTGMKPARSGIATSAGCCRILPDAAAAVVTTTTTITITMMMISTSTSTGTSSGNTNA
jgi:hypothetical protein